MKAFYQQLGQSLTYPRRARARRLQGTTYTAFAIDEEGNMIDIIPLTRQTSALHKKVVQILSQMKGYWNGAYQRVNLILPVVFLIEGEKQNLRDEPPPSDGRLLEEVKVVARSES